MMLNTDTADDMGVDCYECGAADGVACDPAVCAQAEPDDRSARTAETVRRAFESTARRRVISANLRSTHATERHALMLDAYEAEHCAWHNARNLLTGHERMMAETKAVAAFDAAAMLARLT